MYHGKSILITGASSGLGAAMAHAFAEAGANLALFSFEKERQEEVAESCRSLGVKAVPVIGDVTATEDCARYVDTAVAELGSVDVLIVNAGISMWSRFEDVDDLGVFKKLMEVNYLGAVNCIHPALPHLRKSKGVITAITSIQSKIGVPLHSGYVASKHALQGFCETLRMELQDSGVDILTVLPHWIRGTDLRKNALQGDGKALGESSRKHSSQSVSVEEACSAIMKAILDRKRDLIIPWKLKLLLGLNLIAPSIAESIIRGAVSHQDADRRG
jgi:NAD(P)-dependent dehydrogenase (short-subunit alcohol dehydrogenase family)